MDRLSPVRFFVFSVLFFGPIFVFITPPFQSPDEQAHYLRAYHVSQLNFTLVKGDPGLLGGYLPKSLGEAIRSTFVHPASPGYVDTKVDTYKILDVAAQDTNPEVTKFYDFSATGLNTPVTYLPQAAGIGAARIFNGSPLALMYAGRFFNMLAWAAIGGLAVYFMPRKKWAVVFLGLLPMTLAQASSLSADTVAIGSLLLFFSYILHLRESRRRLSYKQLALLLLFAILMTTGKQTMFIFLPLVLLLPDRLFSRKRFAYLIKLGLMAVPLLFMAGWLLLNRELSSVVAAHPNSAVPREQLKFVILNPHSFINVLWNSYFFMWGDLVTKSFIGTFGWVNVPLSEGIVAIGYVSMTLVLAADAGQRKTREWLSGHLRLFVGLIALVYWISINAALYLFNSPVGFKIIVGLQGRYLLPVAIMLVPVIAGSWLKMSKNAYYYVAILSPIFLLTASVITIYVRYYVNNV